MTKQKDGGPAFPLVNLSDGMSLRDWFAGQALAGCLAHPGDGYRGNYHNNSNPTDTAKAAYSYADAMLAAREAAQ